jgi:hypothetical protein
MPASPPRALSTPKSEGQSHLRGRVQGAGGVMPSSARRRSIFDMVGLPLELEVEGQRVGGGDWAITPAAIAPMSVRRETGAPVPLGSTGHRYAVIAHRRSERAQFRLPRSRRLENRARPEGSGEPRGAHIGEVVVALLAAPVGPVFATCMATARFGSRRGVFALSSSSAASRFASTARP